MFPQHRDLRTDKGYDLRRFTSGAHILKTPKQNGRDGDTQNMGGHYIPYHERAEKTSSPQGTNLQEPLKNTHNIGETRKLHGFDFKRTRRKTVDPAKCNNNNSLGSNAIVLDTSISSLCLPDRLVSGDSPLPSLQLMVPDLWAKFHRQQNEMIITKSGRCLFPCLLFKAVNLDPDSIYTIRLDFEKLDPHRLRFSNGKWTPALSPKRSDDSSSDNESMVTEILAQESYTHPDLYQTGAYWMSRPISFAKVKLSNNFAISDIGDSRKNGDIGDSSHLFHMKSFRRYRPRVHLTLCSQQTQAVTTSKTFIFDRTAFIAVTHYQNYRVNDLKKGFNPHAKGFRDTIGKPYPPLRTGCRRIHASDYVRGARRAERSRVSTDSTCGEINWSKDEINDSSEDNSSGISENSGKGVGDRPGKECTDAVEDDNSLEVTYKYGYLCRMDKINKSMVTISIAKDAHLELKMPERSSGRRLSEQTVLSPCVVDEPRQVINGTIRDESPSLCASGTTAIAHNHEPNIATKEFNRLQETLAGMTPKLNNHTFGQVNRQIDATHTSSAQIPTPLSSIPLLTRQPSFVQGRVNPPVPDANQTNSTTIVPTIPTTPTPSWYQQFFLWDQPSPVPPPPNHSPVFDAPTQDLAGTALQFSLQVAIDQNTLVPEIMRSPELQPTPPEQQHLHQQPVQSTPPLSPLFSGPYMDVECHDMQGVSILDDIPVPCSREAAVPVLETEMSLDAATASNVGQIHPYTYPRFLKTSILESTTFMSTSSVISLPPYSAYSGRTHLESILRENVCLKAFIRERYGQEAEADANAVVAMQYYR